MFVDGRQVTGIKVWIKPAKFMASIAIYLWTLAWFIGYLRDSRWGVRIVAWGASLAMIVETGCLWIQAVRGTSSHFNIATAFDGTIFGLMGQMIAINSLCGVVLLALFFWHRTELPSTYYWAICAGLAVFLAGSFEGMIMIGNMAHTVGAPDGGRVCLFLTGRPRPATCALHTCWAFMRYRQSPWPDSGSADSGSL